MFLTHFADSWKWTEYSKKCKLRHRWNLKLEPGKSISYTYYIAIADFCHSLYYTRGTLNNSNTRDKHPWAVRMQRKQKHKALFSGTIHKIERKTWVENEVNHKRHMLQTNVLNCQQLALIKQTRETDNGHYYKYLHIRKFNCLTDKLSLSRWCSIYFSLSSCRRKDDVEINFFYYAKGVYAQFNAANYSSRK